MTYTWSTGFEGFPGGSAFGSVSGLAIRNIMLAFKERLSVEHIWDADASPECYHKAGYCSIAEIQEDTPTSLLVTNALQFYGGLYRDTGAAMEAMTASSHIGLLGIGDDDHPQYLLITGGTFVGTLDLNNNEITGMKTALDVGEVSEEALSRGMHLGDAGAGGCKHANNAIALADGGLLGLDKLKKTLGSVGLAGNEPDITMTDYASAPWVSTGTDWEIRCSTVAADDYVGAFTINENDVSGTLYWWGLDA